MAQIMTLLILGGRGVSQWENSPIKKTPHLLQYHLQFAIIYIHPVKMHLVYIANQMWSSPRLHLFIQDIHPVCSLGLVRGQF